MCRFDTPYRPARETLSGSVTPDTSPGLEKAQQRQSHSPVRSLVAALPDPNPITCVPHMSRLRLGTPWQLAISLSLSQEPPSSYPGHAHPLLSISSETTTQCQPCQAFSYLGIQSSTLIRQYCMDANRPQWQSQHFRPNAPERGRCSGKEPPTGRSPLRWKSSMDCRPPLPLPEPLGEIPKSDGGPCCSAGSERPDTPANSSAGMPRGREPTPAQQYSLWIHLCTGIERSLYWASHTDWRKDS